MGWTVNPSHLPAAELRPHLNLATATMLPAGYVPLQECPFPAIAADEAKTKGLNTFGPTTVLIDGVAMLAKAAFFAVVLASTLLSVVAISADPSRITPNDPFFRYQISFDSPGGILRIPTFSFRSSMEEYSTTPGLDHNVVRAWSITTGSKDVVVALLDDGFFYQHEDLKDNIWHNPGETGVDAAGHRKEMNGVDDDHDGYVDDVVGWDFAFDDPDPDAYIFAGMDASRIQPYGHGTAALGIIGAKGNNGIGVAGINWDVSMMLLKIGAQGIKRGDFDQLRVDRAVKAIHYAVDHGAKVINWSGFVDDKRPDKLASLKAAIQYAGAHGVLVVVAAGNSMKDLDEDHNCTYPQCFNEPNMLNVAEIGFDGELDAYSGSDRISGSNYGVRRVHIAAIARNFTTDVRNGVSVYRLAGGTSNAAPVVTGIAALVLSVRPELKAVELRQVLMDSAQNSLASKGESRLVVSLMPMVR